VKLLITAHTVANLIIVLEPPSLRSALPQIPIGPVIQAMYGSQSVADHMHYLKRALADNVECARLNGGMLDSYDDTTSGQALLDACSDYQGYAKPWGYHSGVLKGRGKGYTLLRGRGIVGVVMVRMAQCVTADAL
jgi:hypothetical protein